MEHENAPVTASTNNFEETRTNAEAVLARKLSSQTIGDEGSSQFLDGTVNIDTGIESSGWQGGDQKFFDAITVTIEGNSVDKQPNEVRKAIEKTFHDIPFVDELVRTGSLRDEIQDVKTALEELKNAGADIPESVFKWAGFDKENEKNDEVDDYMISVAANSQGVHVSFNLPEHLPSGMNTDDITTHITANEDKIKDAMAQKIAAANGGDKAAIREQLNSLEFIIRDHGEHVEGDHVSTGRVEMEIVSPEQKQAKEDADDKAFEPPQADPELEKTNPLQALDALELSKAVSSSIQKGGGEKAGDIIPVILGAKDVMHKIEKALTPFKEEHPELEHQIAEVLNSNIFDRTSPWNRDENAKFEKQGMRFNVKQNKAEDASAFRNRMTATITIPEGQASKIIEKLSAMDANAAKQQFASVDSMRVVGVQSPHPEVQQAVAPFVGQELVANDNDKAMKPIAENLIRQVEEAHKLIEQAATPGTSPEQANDISQRIIGKIQQAHQSIRDGIKTGAEQIAGANPCQAANPCKPVAAAIVQAAAPCKSLNPCSPCAPANLCNPCAPHKKHATKLAENFKVERPSPVMAPDFIKQLGNRTGLALGA